MRFTLSRKLLLYIGSMVIILLTVAFLVMERNQAQAWEDYLVSQSLAFARLATPELLKRFRGSFPPDEPAEISAMHEFLGLNRDLMQFSLIAASGRRLYVSAVFPGFEATDLGRFHEEDLGSRLAAARPTLLTRRIDRGRRVLDLVEPAFGPTGEPVLSVRYLISYDSIDARMAEVRHHLLAVGLIAVAGCLLVVGVIARRMTRPIEDLTRGARALARGDLETRIPKRGQDELGTLAGAFNDMTENLAASRAELEAKNQALSRANQELRSMQDQLLRSERLAAIGQLAAGISHEIDNPVGIILGHAELLLADLDEDDPRREDVQAVIDECRRCKRITGGLLGFARPSSGDYEVLDLTRLIGDAVRSLQPQRLFKEVAVRLRLPDGSVYVRGDGDQLRQILINVLLNAAQAMSGRGELDLKLARQDGQAILTIDDTGPGIAEQAREQVFQPFYSTKAPGEGTGLGLAVCRKLLDDHGGDIRAGASPAGGGRFTVRLPIAEKDVATNSTSLPGRGSDNQGRR